LVASKENGTDNDFGFGKDVSFSGDGNTAMILSDGSAYIFARSGASWAEQAKLEPLDKGENVVFRGIGALSLDGTTAIVRAEISMDHASFVFVRSGTVWTQQAKLVASDKARSNGFGMSVALSADGSTAIVGAIVFEPPGSSDYPAAYIFIRLGTTWTEQTRIMASHKQNMIGTSVSLSSDGSTAIIAAMDGKFVDNFSSGAVYIFVGSGRTWTRQAKLVANNNINYNYDAASVSLSADGSTAIVGSPLADPGGVNDAGAAAIFVRSGSTWTEQAMLEAYDKAQNVGFGKSVSLSADGSTAIVGAPSDDVDWASRAGSAYIFVRSGRTWTQRGKLVEPKIGVLRHFGTSVSLSAKGNTAIIGSSGSGPGLPAGSAYVMAW
jgi:hypothetical protein